MRLFYFKNTRGVFRTLLGYGGEVAIIFIGITISFLFEQWWEERQEKKDLIELSESLINDAKSLKAKLKDDLEGSDEWIRVLDSIHTERISTHVSKQHLVWLYRLISGQELFLFVPQSPAYFVGHQQWTLGKVTGQRST